jgi:LysM repeat protein
VDQSRLTRWAAPVAFLAAITIGALVVRAGFHSGGHHHAQTPTTTVTSTKKHAPPSHKAHRTYTVQSGDTLGGIAAKTGTTVTELEHLNPGIDPQALHVGEPIRVK